MAPPAPRDRRHKKTFSFGPCPHRSEARAEERGENTQGTDRGPLARGMETLPHCHYKETPPGVWLPVWAGRARPFLFSLQVSAAIGEGIGTTASDQNTLP